MSEAPVTELAVHGASPPGFKHQFEDMEQQREADSLGNSLAYQAGAELGEPVAKGLFTIKRLAPSENFREYGMWVIWQG